jgi:hypothetical protein
MKTPRLLNRATNTAGVVFVLLSLALGQNAQQPGIYVDQSGTLVALTPAAYSGTQSSNKIVKANVAWTFRGSHSPLQLSTNHPRFRLVCGYGTVQLLMLCQPGASQPSDLIVVQLDEKSDHRESRMASGNMFGAGHGGFDPKRTVTVTTAKREDGSWDLSPSSQDLRPGEYLITTGMSPQGFDFGIQKQQK